MIARIHLKILRQKIANMALAGVAQWIERQLGTNGSLVDSQSGHMLGCRTGPWWGPYERQPHIAVSLPPLKKKKKKKQIR